MFLRTLPPGLKRLSDPPTTTMLSGFISFSFIIGYNSGEGMNFRIQETGHKENYKPANRLRKPTLCETTNRYFSDI
jgi:hypothetical protein